MTKSRNILRPRQYWQPEQLALVASMYPECHAADVAAWVGRTITAVYQAATKLGLQKSAEYQASVTSGRIQRGHQHPNMIATQFKPGQASWNHGIKGSTGLHPNCRAHQFKPGIKPHTTMPVGSYRINKDGHLQQKIGEASGCNSKRWRGVAELVWVAANGPLPPKHIVVFRPGMFTTVLEQITLDRVECISLAENMRRNSFRNNYPPEVVALIQTQGHLNRVINRRERLLAGDQHA